MNNFSVIKVKRRARKTSALSHTFSLHFKPNNFVNTSLDSKHRCERKREMISCVRDQWSPTPGPRINLTPGRTGYKRNI